jgi:uncharacterized membrane protein YcfT
MKGIIYVDVSGKAKKDSTGALMKIIFDATSKDLHLSYPLPRWMIVLRPSRLRRSLFLISFRFDREIGVDPLVPATR